MRKLTFVLGAALCCLVFACQTTVNTDPAAVSATPAIDNAGEKNLEAMHTVNKAFETGDFSAIRGLLADDAVDHAGETGDIKGADSIIAMMQTWAKMAPNMKSSVIKELADKDYVFQWMKSSGTMAEDAFGMKKGQSFDSEAIEVTKFNADGKMTEHWTFMSYSEMAKMMGDNK
jgi:predicted SnoaL-like aldol condensation-catalyzing enzyme